MPCRSERQKLLDVLPRQVAAERRAAPWRSPAGRSSAARPADPVARRLQHPHRRDADLGLVVGREAVVEQDDRPAPAGSGIGRVPAEPLAEVVAGERRQGPPPVDAGGLLEQPLEQRVPQRRVGQRGRGRADRVEPEDLAHQQVAQAAAAARVVLVEDLGLELGHVDLRRALALARLALEAEVEGLVEGLVAPARRRSPAARRSSPAAARWRGRGSCASRRA